MISSDFSWVLSCFSFNAEDPQTVRDLRNHLYHLGNRGPFHFRIRFFIKLATLWYDKEKPSKYGHKEEHGVVALENKLEYWKAHFHSIFQEPSCSASCLICSSYWYLGLIVRTLRLAGGDGKKRARYSALRRPHAKVERERWTFIWAPCGSLVATLLVESKKTCDYVKKLN